MKQKMLKESFVFFIVYFCVYPKTVRAVIPPDFVFNIGTQVAQFFSIIVIFFTAVLGTFFQFFKARFYSIRHRKIFILSVVISVGIISLGLAYFYANYKQKAEYDKWLEESSRYAAQDMPADRVSSDQSFGLENDVQDIPLPSNPSESDVSGSESDSEFPVEPDFFAENVSKNIIVTNQEFKDAIESGENDYLVLDARENIEYENGNFPDSVHIRFVDLEAGRWMEIPEGKFVYVICWSGIRGKEVADFLRTKQIVASYLENGANGWVEFGGQWTGGIKFLEKYTAQQYQVVFSTSETKKRVEEGAVLVDTREPLRFQKNHIAGSINIPIMYTSTADMEKVFGQVPAGSRVITVCDGYVNCFDAKITGVELELRGHQFLGRYNKPWEYGK